MKSNGPRFSTKISPIPKSTPGMSNGIHKAPAHNFRQRHNPTIVQRDAPNAAKINECQTACAPAAKAEGNSNQVRLLKANSATGKSTARISTLLPTTLAKPKPPDPRCCRNNRNSTAASPLGQDTARRQK